MIHKPLFDFFPQPSVLAFSLLSIELPQYITLHKTSDIDNLEWVLTGLQQFTKVSENDLSIGPNYLSLPCYKPYTYIVQY